MYDGREKQIEIAESINTKADEIESYVLQIITASREDFLSLEVEMGEFYLSELISKIKLYYTEKLRLIRTDFFVGSYMDRLLKGDLDRSVEVLQNVMENANQILVTGKKHSNTDFRGGRLLAYYSQE